MYVVTPRLRGESMRTATPGRVSDECEDMTPMDAHTVNVIHGQESKAAVSVPMRYVWAFCCYHLDGVGYDVGVGQHDAFG